MNKHRNKLSVLSGALLTAFAVVPFQAAWADANYGDYGKQTLMSLVREHPGRYAGADAEHRAAAYMQQRMTFEGYDAAPQQQAFTFLARRGPLSGSNVASNNVVLHKSGSGQTGKTLYVGAHYDSYPGRPTLQGLDDNASGAAMLTELARNLRGIDTEHNLSFISFGAEEYGLEGAKHFVNQMSATDRQNALGMINMDSLITGDKMYGNAGDRAHDTASGQPVPHYAQLREHTHRIARELGIDLHINPGDKEYENTGAPYKPKGVGCCSDQEVFDAAGIPVVAFEATNWDLPGFDGYTQTDNPQIEDGYTWHIPERDNEAYLLAALGQERIDQRMRDFSRLVSRLIIEQTNADVLQSMKSAAETQNQASAFVHQQASQDRLAIRQRAEGLRLPMAAPGGWWLDARYRHQHSDHSGLNNGQLGLYFDHALSPRWRLGSGVSFKGSQGHRTVDKDRAYGLHAYALYGGHDTPWWNTATLGWHQHRLHLKRHIHLGGGDTPVLLDQQASGKARARVLSLGNELGYDFIRHERSRHGAYIGLQYQQARIGGHHSGDAGRRTDLYIEPTRDRRFNSELGYQWQQQLHWGVPLSLSARLGWVREWRRPGIDTVQARAHADGQMRSVRHQQDSDRHYGQLGLGLQAAVSKNMHSHVHLDTTLGKKTRQSAVQLGLQYRF